MKRACLLFVVAACATDPEPIEYSGATHRFVVDAIQLPMTSTQAREYGADLNGDHAVDNQLGMVVATLASFDDITTHAPEMIAAGAIQSSVELVSDDLGGDDTVALHYLGRDGDIPTLVGGALRDGRFETRDAGAAAVWLPVFVDADPSVLPLESVHVTLVADGHGGFDGTLAGAVPVETAHDIAFRGIQQMLQTRPGEHVTFFRLLAGSSSNPTLTREAFKKSQVIQALLAADLKLDGVDMLSIGFKFHLTPCAEGRCPATEFPPPSCFDRIKNGDETDLDCGGACGACPGGLACNDASDCQSGACDGVCADASCDDGVRDGFETDVDCGSGCGGCAIGQTCFSDADCASKRCGPPCTGTLCGDYELDTCR